MLWMVRNQPRAEGGFEFPVIWAGAMIWMMLSRIA